VVAARFFFVFIFFMMLFCVIVILVQALTGAIADAQAKFAASQE
jgi:hypothetical protein